MIDPAGRGERASDLWAKRIGSVLLIGGMFAAAWMVLLVGFVLTTCLHDGPCTKSQAPFWWSVGIGATLILATGPTAWLLSGRRRAFLATPLLVIPAVALLRALLLGG